MNTALPRRDGAIDIFLHDFDYPTEQVNGYPVRVVLQSNFVSRIENATNGKEMFSLELEPELVTGLYERIWQERRVVRLSEVPPLLIKSILAVEDERFYSHHGVDPIGVLRAMWVNLRSFSFQQGGSTLTQQLMKNFLLTDERTLTRKIPEAVMALIAERKYSKEMILENYLNEIYLGQTRVAGNFRRVGSRAVLFCQAAVRLDGRRIGAARRLDPRAQSIVALQERRRGDETTQCRIGQAARRPDYQPQTIRYRAARKTAASAPWSK